MSSKNFRTIVRALAERVGREGFNIDTYTILHLGEAVEEVLYKVEGTPETVMNSHDSLVSWTYNDPEAMEEIWQSKKIHAIKRVRFGTSTGLREAKEAVEAVMAIPAVTMGLKAIDDLVAVGTASTKVIRALEEANAALRSDRDDCKGQLKNYWEGHCPHGLSRDLCDGPGHYPPDAPDYDEDDMWRGF